MLEASYNRKFRAVQGNLCADYLSLAVRKIRLLPRTTWQVRRKINPTLGNRGESSQTLFNGDRLGPQSGSIVH